MVSLYLRWIWKISDFEFIILKNIVTDVGKALKGMIASEGVLGMWRGLGATVFRDVPFSGIYWAVYESIKAHNNVTVPTFWFSFFGGAIAGSVSHYHFLQSHDVSHESYQFLTQFYLFAYS